MNKQPNSDYCFVCGIKSAVGLRLLFEDDGESVVQSRFEIPSSLQPGEVRMCKEGSIKVGQPNERAE